MKLIFYRSQLKSQYQERYLRKALVIGKKIYDKGGPSAEGTSQTRSDDRLSEYGCVWIKEVEKLVNLPAD